MDSRSILLGELGMWGFSWPYQGNTLLTSWERRFDGKTQGHDGVIVTMGRTVRRAPGSNCSTCDSVSPLSSVCDCPWKVRCGTRMTRWKPVLVEDWGQWWQIWFLFLRYLRNMAGRYDCSKGLNDWTDWKTIDRTDWRTIGRLISGRDCRAGYTSICSLVGFKCKSVGTKMWTIHISTSGGRDTGRVVKAIFILYVGSNTLWRHCVVVTFLYHLGWHFLW